MFGKVRTCVLNMPMNEGQGHPHDSSGYGNNGTNNGAVWTSGDYGWAMDFNGSTDYVDCGTDDTLNFGTENFSSKFWFKTPDTGVGGRFIVQKETVVGGIAPGYNAFIVGGGGLRAVVCDGTNEVDIITPLSYDDDAWHHGAITWDGASGTLRIYVDGVDVRNYTNAAVGDIDSALSTKIGGTSTQSFDGTIADVWIYNRVLTATEILNYFNATKSRYGL